MRRLHPHLLLIPALNLCSGSIMAAAPAGFGTWTDLGTGSITAQCTSGFTCTTGTTDSGFLQRQISDPSGTNFQTVVTGDGGTVTSDPVPVYASPLPAFPIQGDITDAESGNPIANIEVSVFYSDGNPVSDSITILTDELGHYSTPALLFGNYFVKADGDRTYQAELYHRQPCLGECDVTTGAWVTIGTDSAPAPVDFSLARGSRITGSIIDSDTGLPVQDVTAMIVAENGVLVTSGTTDINGFYETTNALPPGKYFAHTVNSSSYIDERYNGETCVRSCDFLDDTVIEIKDSKAVTGIDFSLQKGGQLSGMVTAAGSGTPLADISVIIDDTNGSPVLAVPTDSAGHYITGTGLPAGQYYLRTANKDAYINRIYDGPDCVIYDCDVTTGSRVDIAKGVLTSDINFSLVPGGGISGTITDALSGENLPAAIVYIYNSSGTLVDIVNASNGFYQTDNGLQTGSYFATTGNFLGYINERYNDLPLAGYGGVADGTPISVIATQTTLGIDFALEKGNLITGTITSEKSGLPTPARILIFDRDGDPVSMAYVDKDGLYTSGASLPPGEYYVEAEDLSGHLDSKLYRETTFSGNCTAWQRCDVMTGNPVNIATGTDLQEINFVLSAKVTADNQSNGNTISTSSSGTGTVSVPVLMFLLLAGIRCCSRRAVQ